MAEIHSSNETESTAYFCPKCNSPSFQYLEDRALARFLSPGGSTVGRPCKCTVCPWVGTDDQLVQSSFKHGFKSDDEIAETMMRELRNLLSKTAAQSYGRFLLKWGFLDMPISGLQLAHYMDAIAKTVVMTIIETRKQLVEDKARERSGVSGPAGSKDG